MLAAIPVAVTAVHALDIGWTPSSDDGVIALRAFDVVSAHPPLVGQYSQTSPLIGEPVYSLGPMLYWLLAVPAHLGPDAIVLTMAAVNIAAVVGIVVLAGRRGGPLLASLMAVGVVLLWRSLPVEISYEVWNAWAGVWPFTLMLFLAWSVACGDHPLLVPLALAASFVAQTHLTYLAPTLLAVGIAVAGLVYARRSRPLPHLRRWAIAAGIVVAVCWSAPVLDQLRSDPGNLGQAFRLATDDHPTLGIDSGLDTSARAIGVPPWWARESQNPAERLIDLLDVPTLGVLSAIAVVAALAVLLGIARRRGRTDLVTGIALALALCLSIVVVAASMPAGLLGFAAVGYTLAWTAAPGMWVWIVLIWSLLVLVVPVHLAGSRGRLAGALGVVAVLAILVALQRDYDDPGRLPPGLKDYELIRATADAVANAVSGSRGVLIDTPIGVRNSLTFQSAIAYRLRREGLVFMVPPRLVKEMGDQYGVSPGYDRVVSIRDGDAMVSADSQVVVRNQAVTIIVTPVP
jgi:hypothetical protein